MMRIFRSIPLQRVLDLPDVDYEAADPQYMSPVWTSYTPPVPQVLLVVISSLTKYI
jgi:hypothetical protein